MLDTVVLCSYLRVSIHRVNLQSNRLREHENINPEAENDDNSLYKHLASTAVICCVFCLHAYI